MGKGADASLSHSFSALDAWVGTNGIFPPGCLGHDRAPCRPSSIQLHRKSYILPWWGAPAFDAFWNKNSRAMKPTDKTCSPTCLLLPTSPFSGVRDQQYRFWKRTNTWACLLESFGHTIHLLKRILTSTISWSHHFIHASETGPK